VRFSKALIALSLVAVALTVRSSAQTVGAGPFVAGEILVKFRPGVNANARADAHREAGAAPIAEIQRTGLQRVRVPGRSETAAIALYQRNPNVLYAEPNFLRSIPTPTAHTGGSELVPGDYYFDEQWALDNTGQAFYCIPWPFGGELCLYQGTPDADIDAPEAWAILRGSSSVTVAVIDSGIDYTHPDLAANYAGGDDFVFLDGDPMDDHGHGTHVAGTIAAAMDNPTGTPAESEGVVGVTPNARIRAYKVCRADGTCDDPLWNGEPVAADSEIARDGWASFRSDTDRLTFHTPAGAGFGDPHQRERARIEADLRQGLVTPEGAARGYGYRSGR